MIDEVLAKLTSSSFYGCSEEILNEAIKEQNVTHLPEAYRKFMLAFGTKFDNILGDSCSCYMLQEGGFKEVLIYELKKIEITLPDDAFVFYCHDGYVWYFFRTKDNIDDPPIYCYWEPDPGIRLIAGSFSQLLELKLSGKHPNKRTRKAFAVFFNYDPEKDSFYLIKDKKEIE